MSQDKLKLGRDTLEPLLNEALELNDLDAEVVLTFLSLEGRPQLGVLREVRSCAGDIYKIVNMMMDYARILEAAIREWDLQGLPKAHYEHSAMQYRRMAKKYAAAIGYDYGKAAAKLRKKNPVRREDDVGGEALSLTVRREEDRQ